MKNIVLAASLVLVGPGPYSDQVSPSSLFTLEFWPVCVFGKMFGNKCAAKYEYPDVDESGIQLREFYRTEPICDCSSDYAPVCALGKTFRNRCTANCGYPLPNRLIQDGKCDEDIVEGRYAALTPATPRCRCTKEYKPVCFNGITYDNFCTAKCYGAIDRRIQNGECTLKKTCKCTLQYAPICYKGQTFINACGARCKGARDEDIVEGRCDALTTTTPRCRYTNEYKPVCFNGAIYNNLSIAERNRAIDRLTASGPCNLFNF